MLLLSQTKDSICDIFVKSYIPFKNFNGPKTFVISHLSETKSNSFRENQKMLAIYQHLYYNYTLNIDFLHNLQYKS